MMAKAQRRAKPDSAAKVDREPKTPGQAWRLWARNVGGSAAIWAAGAGVIFGATFLTDSFITQETGLVWALLGLTLLLPFYWILETVELRDRLRKFRAEGGA